MIVALWIEAAAAAPGCAITGESIDADPAGLRVHAAPSLASPVVGRLYPGMDPHAYFHDEKATLREALVGANFTVDSVDGDWLRIRDIDPVTDGLDPDGGLDPIANHQGQGWVHASLVRLVPANGEDLRTRPGGKPAPQGTFAPLDARIVACSGTWAGLRLDDGSTGWLPSRSNKARAATIRAAMRKAETP